MAPRNAHFDPSHQRRRLRIAKGDLVLLFSGQASTADLLEQARGRGYEFDLLRWENRIRLSETAKDVLGMPKAVVDWRVSQNEIQPMRRYAQFLRKDLNRFA